jgi:hypothetical protein
MKQKRMPHKKLMLPKMTQMWQLKVLEGKMEVLRMNPQVLNLRTVQMEINLARKHPQKSPPLPTLAQLQQKGVQLLPGGQRGM